MKKSSRIKNFVRWLAVFPLALLTLIVARILISIAWAQVPGDVTLETLNSFNGHYILGPLVVLSRESIAIMLAFFVALKLAPSHKREIFYALCSIWGIYTILFLLGLLSTEISFPDKLFYLVYLAAQLSGILSFKGALEKQGWEID